MRKSIIILLSILPCVAFAQQNYTIRVNVKNVSPQAKAYLNYKVNQQVKQDSATLINKQFVFKGTQESKMKAFVLLSHDGKPVKQLEGADQVAVYLENGTIEVNTTDSLLHATVVGTVLNHDQQEMINFLEPLKIKGRSLVEAYDHAEGNLEEQEKLKAEFAALQVFKNNAIDNFIKSHANSLVSLNLMLTNIDPAQDITRASTLFNSLTAEVQNSKNGLTYKNAISAAKTVEVGRMAPNFNIKNPKGENIALSAFKGKYVLLDFWASWCIPCRKESPNLVTSFNKFKEKNFTVLGVSLDGVNTRQQWIDAIEKDGLKWEQVSELMGWQSPVAQLYQINSVPANFLIDPSGKIIARDLHGEALNEKLKSIL